MSSILAFGDLLILACFEETTAWKPCTNPIGKCHPLMIVEGVPFQDPSALAVCPFNNSISITAPQSPRALENLS